jgi:hypothetical protein
MMALSPTLFKIAHQQILLKMNPVRDARWKAHVGGRVDVVDKGAGTLLYYGPTAKSKGVKKCGVALDEPNGKVCSRIAQFPVVCRAARMPSRFSLHRLRLAEKLAALERITFVHFRSDDFCHC